MDIFEGKNKRYCKRLTKFGRNIVLRIKPRAAMIVVRFANFKSRALFHEPSSDCVIARAKGSVRAQASYGNITVLSLLNLLVGGRIHGAAPGDEYKFPVQGDPGGAWGVLTIWRENQEILV